MPDFETKLNNLIDTHFEDAITPIKKLRDEIISALKIKLIALKEKEIDED